LSSPKKCINKNDDLATTPTSIANNNIDTPLTNEVIKVVAIDEREKRDRSTEKQLIIGEDEIIIIAADSLENLRSDEVAADLKNEEEVIMAEDDEGLGDINHGSEASR
jgi:predicted glycosyltransferase